MALLVTALDRKRIATVEARAILAGGHFVATDDDRGRPQYVVNIGAATLRTDSLSELESLLDQIELKERHV